MSSIRLKIQGESFWGYRYPDLPENQAEINNHPISGPYGFGDRVEFDENRNIVRLVKTREEVEEEMKIKEIELEAAQEKESEE